MTTTNRQPKLITASDSLNTIVAHYPQTLPVMQRFGLDTCCGGSVALCVAARHHGLNINDLIVALRAAVEETTR